MKLEKDSPVLLNNQFILSMLRRFYIQRMIKPEDTELISSDEPNQKYMDRFLESCPDLYKNMKTTLVALANNNTGDTLQAIDESIQLLSTNFDSILLNSICWSVCALSGVFPEPVEKTFLTKFLEFLNQMINVQGDPRIRTDITMAMMIIVSQYPRYFANSFQLFQAILERLFEIMRSSDDENKELAVRIFRVIATPCSKQFLTNRINQGIPYIVEIINNFNSIVSTLNPEQIVYFVGTFSRVIMKNSHNSVREDQVGLLLEGFNLQWESLLLRFNIDDNSFSHHLLLLLRLNLAVVEVVQTVYYAQFAKVFLQLIDIYTQYSNALRSIYGATQVLNDNQSAHVKMMLNIKSTIINIFIHFSKKMTKLPVKMNDFIDKINSTFVLDFGSSHPLTRVPEIFSLVSLFLRSQKYQMVNLIPSIFSTLFHEGMEMTRHDFIEFPFFRFPFFEFVHDLAFYVAKLIEAPQDEFAIYVQTLMWGSSHPTFDVSRVCLLGIVGLITNVKNSVPQYVDFFFGTFYVPLVNHVFQVLTDTIHKFVFEEQVDLLRTLLQENIALNVLDPIVTSISPLLPMKHPQELLNLLGELIQTINDKSAFRIKVRDFLISSNTFSLNDDALYITENKQLIQEEASSISQFYSGPSMPTGNEFLE